MDYLLILIILLLPVVGHWYAKRLRISKSDADKRKAYWIICVVYFSLSLLCLLRDPWRSIFYPVHTVPFSPLLLIISLLVILYFLLTNVLPAVLLPFSKVIQEKMREEYDSSRYPVTGEQQLMFLFVAVFVGVGEEIIYRGFLFNDLAGHTTLPPLVCFLVITLLFGISHFHQGISGVVSSTLFGFLMGFLYFQTGSLLLPIMLHILYDMKMVFFSRVLQRTGLSS